MTLKQRNRNEIYFWWLCRVYINSFFFLFLFLNSKSPRIFIAHGFFPYWSHGRWRRHENFSSFNAIIIIFFLHLIKKKTTKNTHRETKENFRKTRANQTLHLTYPLLRLFSAEATPPRCRLQCVLCVLVWVASSDFFSFVAALLSFSIQVYQFLLFIRIFIIYCPSGSVSWSFLLSLDGFMITTLWSSRASCTRISLSSFFLILTCFIFFFLFLSSGRSNCVILAALFWRIITQY